MRHKCESIKTLFAILMRLAYCMLHCVCWHKLEGTLGAAPNSWCLAHPTALYTSHTLALLVYLRDGPRLAIAHTGGTALVVEALFIPKDSVSHSDKHQVCTLMACPGAAWGWCSFCVLSFSFAARSTYSHSTKECRTMQDISPHAPHEALGLKQHEWDAAKSWWHKCKKWASKCTLDALNTRESKCKHTSPGDFVSAE